MSESLREMLNDISEFISLKDGENFEGVFVKAAKVQSRFDDEGETIELTFKIKDKEKTCSGVRLARAVLDAGIKEGENVKVSRLSTKGTKVEWKVEKLA
jgi:hypothetical protein